MPLRTLLKFFLVIFLIASLRFEQSLAETMDDLIHREGIWFKRFTDYPFTGSIFGQYQGKMVNGKMEGDWVGYYPSGQLWWKGFYKNGKEEGYHIAYFEDGKINKKHTGKYQEGIKIGE